MALFQAMLRMWIEVLVMVFEHGLSTLYTFGTMRSGQKISDIVGFVFGRRAP
jgi:hypothetical protein